MPGGAAGFGWHYDAEEVFVLQTEGTKHYRLRKNTVNPWPLVETLPDDMQFERESMPLLRCTLNAGDWLYIPTGYWHATQAESDSISLAVGVLAPAAIDALDLLRGQLRESLLWRQRLPTMGAASDLSPDKLRERYRDILRELAQDLSQKLVSEGFLLRLLGIFASQS
jgi:ribosomal protein L16 Arg81 hydroxylase